MYNALLVVAFLACAGDARRQQKTLDHLFPLGPSSHSQLAQPTGLRPPFAPMLPNQQPPIPKISVLAAMMENSAQGEEPLTRWQNSTSYGEELPTESSSLGMAVAAHQPRRLVLVRHGETDFNEDGRIQGTLESKLTEEGHRQAHELGRFLARSNLTIDRVLCSPKARTVATLNEIESAFAEEGATALPERLLRPDLREIEKKSWEGMYRSDVEKLDAVNYAAWKKNPADFVFDTGFAPLPHLWERIKTEWAHLRETTPVGTTALVVAHGTFNRVFLTQIFGMPMTSFVDSNKDQHFGFSNCECAEIEWVETESNMPTIRWRRRFPRESQWRTLTDESEKTYRTHRPPDPM